MIKKILLLMTIVLFSVNAPLLAQRSQVWWTGGTSSDVSNVANWVNADGSAAQALPGADASGNPFDIVRIGTSVGLTGAYEVFTHNTQPVLSTTYPSPDGNSYGGWWFVLNGNNLTLNDGAYLVMNRDNCNLRNGGWLEVQGRSDTDGPSLILAKQFRIGENGSSTDAASETSQLRVNGTGWVQSDPFLPSGTGAAFMIGTSETPGTMPRGEIIIEDSGRVELAEDGLDEMYLYFGNADPSVNQIIIRDNGELWLYGDSAAMGRVGTDNTLDNATVVSLRYLIDNQLIINDQGGQIEVIGSSPTVVKVTGVVSVEDNPDATSLTYELMQNYPNPFNPSTTIQYQIPKAGHVLISVFNAIGQPVATLVDQNMMSGMHHITFDAAEFTSGIYFYKIQAGNLTEVKKMMLLK